MTEKKASQVAKETGWCLPCAVRGEEATITVSEDQLYTFYQCSNPPEGNMSGNDDICRRPAENTTLPGHQEPGCVLRGTVTGGHIRKLRRSLKKA